jgi:hypothetical protein
MYSTPTSSQPTASPTLGYQEDLAPRPSSRGAGARLCLAPALRAAMGPTLRGTAGPYPTSVVEGATWT